MNYHKFVQILLALVTGNLSEFMDFKYQKIAKLMRNQYLFLTILKVNFREYSC
jgi:hypothetical protein